MSTDQTTPDSQTPRQGMSTGCKVLLILGIIFGILLLLCCGGVMMTGWYFANMFSTDPAAVKSTTAEMAEIDIPPELKPQMSMNLKIPFQGQMVIAAAYVDEQNESMLFLMAFGEAIGAADQEQFRRQFNDSLRQQGMQTADDPNIQIDETSSKEFTIRGKPATFVFNKGRDPNTGKNILQVTGTFEGKAGPTMFLMTVDPDHYTEEDVIRIIESIQ